MKLFNACGSILALVLFATVAKGEPTRRALVIGNDSYPGNSLQNGRSDARAIDMTLRSLGYISMLALDADQQAMATILSRFASSIYEGDTVVVYYAGHGLQVDGENYLVPVDFHAFQPNDVRRQGVALHSILNSISEHGATTQIIILDACRDNPFLGSRSLRGGWADMQTSAGTFIAFGTAPGSTASDNPSTTHGLFTGSLLQYLASGLDIDTMFTKVREEVIRSSTGQQVPWIASSLVGSFHIDPKYDVGEQSLSMVATPNSNAFSPHPRSVDELSMLAPMRTEGDLPFTGKSESDLLGKALEEARGVHFDKAITILEAILSADPKAYIALRLLGLLYHLTGRSTDAMTALGRAISISPEDALAHSYLCLVETAEGLEAASPECQQALRLRADRPEAHLGLALSDAVRGDAKTAFAEATDAISCEPKYGGFGP